VTRTGAPRAGLLRSWGMRALHRLSALAILAVFPALLAVPRPARAGATAPPDTGLFVIFDHDEPVAHEKWRYDVMGDSLVVSALAQRTFVDESGQRHEFSKAMLLVADLHDLGLMRYESTQRFAGHTDTRGILPGDTVMTYYRERDGGGASDRLVQPPGRLFVLDSQLFTLFDILGRSVAGKDFRTRPVQLVALGTDSLATPVATLTRVTGDSLAAGGRERLTRYGLDDASIHFDLWTDPQGRLVRLEHVPSGLRVERAAVPAPPAAAGVRRRTPAVPRKK